MVFTEEQCDRHPEIAKTYERWVACWEHYETKLWPLLAAPNPDREVKAQQVEAVGAEFVKLWNTATGGGTQHVYPHMLVAHLPDMIRSMPVDPFDCMLQAMESSHAVRKQLAFKTNKKAPDDEESREIADRRTWVESYMKEEGIFVQGHFRGIGKRRSFQILKRKLLKELTGNLYETRASKAIKHKRWMAAKARRHAKQARWKCKLAVKDLPVLDVVVTESDKEESDKAKGCNSESSSTPSQASSVCSRTDDEADEAEKEQIVAKRRKIKKK